MPKSGSVLGATRTGQNDVTTPGRGRGRGRAANGMKPFASRRGGGGAPARGRGRGQQQQQPSEPAGNKAGAGLTAQPFAGTVSSNSPFAQIKNNNAFPSANGSSAPFMFGKPSPTPESTPLTGFGAPSVMPTAMENNVDHTRDPRPSATSKRPPQNKHTPAPRSNGGSKTVDYQERYEKLKTERNKQRENRAADSNQAQNKTPVGTCTAMCPEFERAERIVQKMVDKCEKSIDPSTDTLEIRELKMVKRFRRSAAGYDEQLPSDIRTPSTLLHTMNYLIRYILNGPEPLGLIHKFVWDRTRSIRNDFSVQQLTKIEDVKLAAKCLERIARFHIISLHLLSSPDNEEQFDHHQEREQLNNTMLSLMHFYEDNQDRIHFPNEAEFRAYYIVLAIHDQRHDIEDRVQRWPREILEHPKVQVALDLYAAASNAWDYQSVLDDLRPNAVAQGFYERFFSLVNSPAVSYLMGCVAEIYFSTVRQTAIRSIWKACCRVPISQQHKNEDWTLDELTRTFYFDDDTQTEEFLEEQGLQLMERDDGVPYLNWGSSSIDVVEFNPSSRHSFSRSCVETKRGGRTLDAIVLGLNVQQAASRGMVDSSIVEFPPSPIEREEDNELFVRQDEPNDTEIFEMQTDQPQNPFFPPPAPLEKPEVPSSQPVLSIFGNSTEPKVPHNPFASSIPSATSSTEPPKSVFSFPTTFQNTKITSTSDSSTITSAAAPPGPFSSWPLSSDAPSVSSTPALITSAEPSEPRPSSTSVLQESKPLFGSMPPSFTSPFTSQPKLGDASATTESTETSNMFSLRPSESASILAPSANPFSTMVPESSIISKPEPVTAENPQPLFPAQSSTFSNQPLVQDTSLLSSIPPAPDSAEPIASVQEDEPPSSPSLVEEHEPIVESPPIPEASAEENQEFRNSWIETLRQAAMSKRKSPPNRKRPLEAEPEVSQAQEPDAVPLQVQYAPNQDVPKPAPARPNPKKASLALASISPLPTLPILEEVRKTTQIKKQEDEVESTKASQVDEDELLLSAARIAAEQLKNGPKLLEHTPNYSYLDPLRSSTILGRSMSSARNSTGAPSPYARINGHEVALAPETPLGLGRTLSRTEQRLRLTGGKGLAYKPLQLTPDRETETGKKVKRKKVKNEF